jgi:hypothetical protein
MVGVLTLSTSNANRCSFSFSSQKNFSDGQFVADLMIFRAFVTYFVNAGVTVESVVDFGGVLKNVVGAMFELVFNVVVHLLYGQLKNVLQFYLRLHLLSYCLFICWAFCAKKRYCTSYSQI